MIARCQLRHHAAKDPVQLDLTEKLVRKKAARVIEDGRRAFIAGGLNGEYAHGP